MKWIIEPRHKLGRVLDLSNAEFVRFTKALKRCNDIVHSRFAVAGVEGSINCSAHMGDYLLQATAMVSIVVGDNQRVHPGYVSLSQKLCWSV